VRVGVGIGVGEAGGFTNTIWRAPRWKKPRR
jgi:hypothetical protein